MKHPNERPARMPAFYRIVGLSTMILALAGVLTMLADMSLSLTPIHPVAYIVWSLCCLSLHLTNILAAKEWKAARDAEDRGDPGGMDALSGT